MGEGYAKGPITLIVLDGFALGEHNDANAIWMARTPNLDRFFAEYPSSKLQASGEAVGVMEGQMGDSNVGHLNLGAGRVVYQDLVRLDRQVLEGSFFENETLRRAMANVRDKGTSLHLMGLVSPGGVHSHSAHLYALLRLAVREGVKKVFVHAFLDGRDVPPSSAKGYVSELMEKCREYGVGEIASVSGRYYAMDRDNRWDRVEKAYRAIVLGDGLKAAGPVEAVETAYARGETDEFVAPTIVTRENGSPVATVEPGDSVVFFNFRYDRARELTRAFTEADFDGFARPKELAGLFFVCMTRYDETIHAPVAFPPQELANTFGEWVAKAGLKQLRIAETEKYAHVTFFFSGGEEKEFPGEERILIPSPKVATYDLKPEMSAYEVTDAVVGAIKSRGSDAIILNFANCDMVGHTGVMAAAVKAVETVDECVGRVVAAVLGQGGKVLLTADHGNADQMVDPETGEPHTAHTLNPAPAIAIGLGEKVSLRDGVLADVAPTLLEMMGRDKPAEMTGQSLIIHDDGAAAKARTSIWR